MPIGVPQILFSFEVDNEEDAEEAVDADWIDLYDILSKERILLLCSELSDEMSNQLIGLFVYFNAENPYKEFFFYINSYGGVIIGAIALFDAINYVSSDVSTIAVGNAFNMASLIVSTGTQGKRISLPHARFLIHEPDAGSTPIYITSAVDETKRILRVTDLVFRLYCERTGQSFERLEKDIYGDEKFYMSAEEAQKYNLVDLVVKEENIINEMITDHEMQQNIN
uniref:ATP-dependent Clp protease proteolytic subunit n=1 Tax=Trentepohlia odorata TaxID=2576626 RepID=A0A4Y5P3G2_9CHLO|nr:Clp protease proteolytic subunit [Trentepohlia odorata]QCW57804.1 Clp protease proteolytic subunit [Trentepohlia odorata]